MFVLIFRMDITTPEAQPSPGKMKEYMEQWAKWISSIAGKGQLSDGGNHLSPKGRLIKQGGKQLEHPYTCENNSVAGYIIVSAKNLDAATEIAKQCPILGGENTSVEIREVANV